MKSQKRQRGHAPLSIVIALVLAVTLCVAFIIAYYRIYQNTHDNLVSATEDKIAAISGYTDSFLQKAKALVAGEASSVEYMMENGCDNGQILDFLLYQTDYKIGNIDKSFTGVYGYYRGEYLDGNRWDPYADGAEYFPTKRPWYLAAKDVNPKVAVAAPYLDMDTGNIVLSITKMLEDGNSVLGMDISLVNLSDYIGKFLADNEFGYAFIIDNTGTIVASKGMTDIGKNFLTTGREEDEKGLGEMFRKALLSDEPFEFSLDGHTHLVISRTIENEWQVITLADAENIYSPLRQTAIACIGLLAALIVILLFFAVSSLVNNKKRRLAQEKEEQYVSELKSYSKQLSNYKRAILSDALIALEVNLTTDNLYYGVWKTDNGIGLTLPEILGMGMPCSYDEYIRKWNERFVKKEFSASFDNRTSREHLLKLFEEGTSEVTFDYEAMTISGRRTWMRRNICMIRSKEGDVIAYTNVKDISALIETEKREKAYIDAMATEYDSIAVIGFEYNKDDDKILQHSRIIEDFAKLFDEEALREVRFSKRLQLLANHIYEDDREFFLTATRREKILESFAVKKTHVVDFRIIGKDREPIYYQERFIPLRDDNNVPIGMIACMRNIDDEFRAELAIRHDLEDAKSAADAANKAKTTFLFNMSHDIRTPMNAIIGFTEMAQKHLDEPQRVEECLGKVHASGKHLLGLINDVLNMARIESGKMQLEERLFNIREASKPAMAIAYETAAERNIELTLLSGPVGDAYVYGDDLKISQIALNIMSNAIKYTEPGGKVTVRIDEVAGTDPDRLLCDLVVEDTGIGMSEEFLAKVFEPFERSASSTKSGIQGTGLGMAITKQLVEQMGGEIRVESKLGIGTKVTVRFNFRRASEEELQHREAEEDQEPDIKVLNGKKILLVEDNELNREIATDILEENGFTVDTAEDGTVAVEKMQNAEPGQYDLILMDIQMPVMDGYEAAKRIRALKDPVLASIPIIAMTANAFEEDRQAAFAAGMNEHIAKPVDVSVLNKTLIKVLHP